MSFYIILFYTLHCFILVLLSIIYLHTYKLFIFTFIVFYIIFQVRYPKFSEEYQMQSWFIRETFWECHKAIHTFLWYFISTPNILILDVVNTTHAFISISWKWITITTWPVELFPGLSVLGSHPRSS